MNKCIHLLIGTGLFGLLIIFYYQIQYAIKSQHHSLLLRTLKRSLQIDIVFIPAIVSLFITGTLLVHEKHFTFTTPWIDVAYSLLLLSGCAAVLCSVIKIKNYHLNQNCRGKPQGISPDNKKIIFKYRKMFRACHWLIFIFFILIIHDAIMKHTIF